MKEINNFKTILNVLRIHFREINGLDKIAKVTRQDIARCLNLKDTNII